MDRCVVAPVAAFLQGCRRKKNFKRLVRNLSAERMTLTASMNKLLKVHLLSSKQMANGLFASWPGRVAVGDENISL